MAATELKTARLSMASARDAKVGDTPASLIALSVILSQSIAAFDAAAAASRTKCCAPLALDRFVEGSVAATTKALSPAAVATFENRNAPVLSDTVVANNVTPSPA